MFEIFSREDRSMRREKNEEGAEKWKDFLARGTIGQETEERFDKENR